MNTITKKLLRQTNLIMGGIITLFVIFVAVFASFMAPYHPVDDADRALCARHHASGSALRRIETGLGFPLSLHEGVAGGSP